MQRTPGSTEAALFCRAGRKILYMVNIQNVFYQIAFCKNKNIQKSLANFRLAYLNLAYLNLNFRSLLLTKSSILCAKVGESSSSSSRP